MSDENTETVEQKEDQARGMGWVPESEWEGEPPKGGFRSAEEFVERGETDPSIARESKRNQELDRRLKDSDARAQARDKAHDEALTEVRKTLADFRDHHEKVDKRAYDRAMKDIRATQRKAVEDGDVEAFDKAEEEVKDLVKEATPKTNGKDATVTTDAAGKADFDAWHKDNDWYDDDVEATQYAESILPIMGRKYPTSRGREFYDKVGEEVRKQFPEKFGNPRRKQPSTVAGAGDGPSGSRGGKTYADLPPEAKAACDGFVKEKLLTKEQYVKEYDWS